MLSFNDHMMAGPWERFSSWIPDITRMRPVMQEQNHPCAKRAEMCAQLFKCHEKKRFMCWRHICPNMSAGALIGYFSITVADKLLNRKEVSSIVGVLIFTCGFSLSSSGSQQREKHDGHKWKMEYCRQNESVIVWMFGDTTDTTDTTITQRSSAQTSSLLTPAED